MNKIIILVLSFLTFTLQKVSAQDKELDSHIGKIVAALKAKDEAAFLQTFPTYNQVYEFMSTMMAKAQEGNPELKAVLDSVMKTEFTEQNFNEEMIPRFKEEFRKIIRMGEEKGLNWSNVSFLSYTSEKNKEEGDVQNVKGQIVLRDADLKYTLPFDKVIWFDQHHSWFGIKVRTVLKGKETEQDADKSVDAILKEEAEMKQEGAVEKKTTGTDVSKTRPAVKKQVVKKPVAKPKTKQ
jgi:hypothetical protein